MTGKKPQPTRPKLRFGDHSCRPTFGRCPPGSCQPSQSNTPAHCLKAEVAGGAFPWCRWLPVLLPAVLLQAAAAGDSAPRAAQQPVDYMIVVTGGELLAGAYADQHTQFLTKTLRPLGLRCVGSMCVDDKPADLKEALRFAAGKASLVLVTGGLGPTDNDITRETLSDFTGIALREDPEALRQMARRFGVPVEQLRTNLRRQTRVPTRGTYLKNPQGTAVGLVFEAADTVIVALPGPPRELQATVRNELIPYLSRRLGTRPPGCSLTVRFVGLGQSQIDQTLKDHVPLAPDITLSSQFEGGRVDFTFSLSGDTPQDHARLEKLKQEIHKYLGDYVYADDDSSLEQCVVRLLAAGGQTLALVEAARGGSLAAGLSGADGAGRALAGAYVAPSEETLRRLLRVPDATWGQAASDTQKTRLLASTAADSTGSQWAIAVGQPRRDEGGAWYAEIAFRLPDGRLENQHVPLSGTAGAAAKQWSAARSRLTTQLLDQLRRRLR
jgi:nicotinamide-nucleotide amidase